MHVTLISPFATNVSRHVMYHLLLPDTSTKNTCDSTLVSKTLGDLKNLTRDNWIVKRIDNEIQQQQPDSDYIGGGVVR